MISCLNCRTHFSLTVLFRTCSDALPFLVGDGGQSMCELPTF